MVMYMYTKHMVINMLSRSSGYIQVSMANISISKSNMTNNSSIATGMDRNHSLSELCFWDYPEYFKVYYKGSQQHCSNATYVVTSDAPEPGNI